MVEDQDGRVFTTYKTEIEPDQQATKKVKTTSSKRCGGKKKSHVPFHLIHALNINGATAQMIADHIKGIGLKTAAKEIKRSTAFIIG